MQAVSNSFTQSTRGLNRPQSVSSAMFICYCLYLAEFFLHLTSRIPPLGAIRFTMLIFAITWILAIVNKPIIAQRKPSEITKALNALLIYLAVSFILTEYPGSVIRDNLTNFLKAISFFYFTVMCVDTKERFKKVVFIFVVMQLFRVYEPLYLNITQGYWGSSTFIGEGFANRLAGSPHDVINANELGFVIVTVIPFLYFLGLNVSTAIKKLATIVGLALLGYALILTMSRGAFLALCVVIWFVFKRAKNKGALIFLLLISVVGALSVMNDTQRERYLSIFGKSSNEASNSTASGRLDGIISEFELGFTSNPIFGNGIGTTAEAKYHKHGIAQASHNFYAQLLIEIGILGAIFFYKYIKSIFLGIKRLIDQAEGEQLQYTNTFYVLFIMYAVYSINYYGLSQSYWYLLGGLVVAFTRLYEKEKNEQD